MSRALPGPRAVRAAIGAHCVNGVLNRTVVRIDVISLAKGPVRRVVRPTRLIRLVVSHIPEKGAANGRNCLALCI